MKKFIISSILVVSLIMPVFALADTTVPSVESIQSQIILALNQLVTLLQQQIQSLQSTQTSMPVPSPTPASSGAVNTANISASLAVKNLVLDGNGVTATFCNIGTNDLPIAPFRIRLNGVNQDFDEVGAHKAGACATDTWQYSTWGLSFDPGLTFTAITIIDPNGLYKHGQITYPSNGGATISVPAQQGVHLAVRSVLLKSTGVQATFCNLGTQTLTSFPVQIILNGISQTFDVPEAYATGKCTPKSWPYAIWGVNYVQGTSYAATVTVDPNNTYKEGNEYDNVATVIGIP